MRPGSRSQARVSLVLAQTLYRDTGSLAPQPSWLRSWLRLPGFERSFFDAQASPDHRRSRGRLLHRSFRTSTRPGRPRLRPAPDRTPRDHVAPEPQKYGYAPFKFCPIPTPPVTQSSEHLRTMRKSALLLPAFLSLLAVSLAQNTPAPLGVPKPGPATDAPYAPRRFCPAAWWSRFIRPARRFSKWTASASPSNTT